jgi:hypothetical protein
MSRVCGTLRIDEIYRILARQETTCQHVILHDFFFFFSFLGWGETDSTWYVGH